MRRKNFEKAHHFIILCSRELNFVALPEQKKATGLDGIPANYTKFSIHSIAPVIPRICNMSTERGVVLNMWKKATQTPLNKSRIPTKRQLQAHFYINPTQTSRPPFANLYVKFLTENDILPNCQHGFCAHHSCDLL